VYFVQYDVAAYRDKESCHVISVRFRAPLQQLYV
jgi:hypothetical protein